ncbi:MAG: DHA2 family efflux MFS transporter permease subunit [Peptococcaceae bacterium]
MTEEITGNNPNNSWILSIIVILIGGFMAILDSSIVNVAIPSLMTDFGVTSAEIEWIVTVYMLTLGVIVPTSGWLGDYLGYKRLYILSLGVFTLGSLLCSLAWDVGSLSIFRVIQGLGGGMIMPITMAMVYRIVPRERIGSAMGTFGLTMLLAPAIGPSLGGYLVEYVSWHWIFSINVPIGVIGILLAGIVIPDFPKTPAGKFDWRGALLAATGLFCLLFAFSEGSEWGWSSYPTVMLFYISLAALGIFVYWELSIEEPLLDLTLFRYGTFAMGNLMLALITIGMFSGVFFIPLFLQSIRGLGAFQTGLLMLPPALVSALVMPISGRLYDKIGPKPLITSGILILAYSTYLFTKLDIYTELTTIIQWNVVRSIGMGLTMMPTQTAIMSVVPNEKVGRASSITNIINRVSGSFGIAILTVMLNHRQTYHSTMLNWNISSYNLQMFLQNSVQEAGNLSQSVISGLLQGNIYKISFVQALNDVFLIMSVLMFMAFFPAFTLKKGDASTGTQHNLGE